MPAAEPAACLAIVGDLHDAWNAFDDAWFARSGYAAILFTGDLGDTRASGLRVATAVADVPGPALVMPGNADARYAAQLRAEFVHRRGLSELLGRDPAEDRPRSALCGYSLHPLRVGERWISVVAGRPFSLGGPSLAFAPQLEGRYGVTSLEESAKRLRELVDACESEELVFLAHNGPTGLGDRAHDPWGCDFKAEEGDWGDPDLREAIEYARGTGRRVLAVVAGHMHLALKQGARERCWQLEQDGILYLNAARVPRIFERDGRLLHHHLALHLGPGGVRAEERFVPES